MIPLFAMVAVVIGFCSASADDIRFNVNTGVPGQRVYITGDLWQWDPRAVLMREQAPGHYATTIPEPWAQQLQYKFIVDNRWMLDPGNPHTIDDGSGKGGCNSLLEIPFQEDPLLTQGPDTPLWQQTQVKVRDPDGQERQIEVLHPPQFEPSRKTVVIYLQDGLDYLVEANIKTVIANLSRDPSMPLMVAVLIPPKDRMTEYGLSPAYSAFVAQTVVPAIESRFQLRPGKANRLIMGSSLGGLASLYTALQYPDIFENVACQSGSMWFRNNKIQDHLRAFTQRQRGKQNLNLYVEIGFFETPEMNRSNEETAILAHRLGLPVSFFRNPSRHDWPSWRNSMSRIFRSFFQ